MIAARPLTLGRMEIWPPVVLAPMVGVTSAPFRRLCRRFGSGLFVCEMISAKGLITGNPYVQILTRFHPDESPRSMQLYAVDPGVMAEAVAMLVSAGRVDHIDLNFGCPVRKLTRKGGGAAIPVKKNLFRALVRAAVEQAGGVPVTIKIRMGIDDELMNYVDVGRIGEDEGVAAVTLHARTVAQLYDGEAHWPAIARLKAAVRSIPVLGNGDIWEAADALNMMRQTGCDGVVVGRGCLGRPWLFRDLQAAFDGRPARPWPNLGAVVDIMISHLHGMVNWFDEEWAVRSFRKQMTWYLMPFASGPELRNRLVQAKTFAEVVQMAAGFDAEEPFEAHAVRQSRGKRMGRQKVALPPGYLDDLEDATPPCGAAEEAVSGG